MSLRLILISFLALGGFARSARAAAASALRPYDLVVYGATGGGVAHAVCAAREGLDVLLISPVPHLGGLLSNGLTTMDTLYNGARAPFYDEVRRNIHEYYRDKYGADSEQFRRSLPGQPKAKVEAHVFERVIDRLIAGEPRVTVMKSYYPVACERTGAQLRTVTFRDRHGPATFAVSAAVFSDCSYEGDLLAVAKVPYRWGRESREEFGEEHAGRIFMRKVPWPPAGVDPKILADFRRMNLAQYNRWFEIIRPASTGVADQSVQAYNLRTVVTRDPVNRLPMARPANYDPAEIQRRLHTDINWSGRVPTPNQPNEKTYLNLPEVVGIQHAYVEGDWATRQRIVDEHARITRCLIYFMQNDLSVPEATRLGWREWGLPRDEFADNGHLPYEIYARETRRIVGRATFTENDARPAPRLKRAPVQADAISVTEWFLDSHACTPEHVPGGDFEGELLLNYVTVPGQISYRTLLPQGLDNLLVPVCASSTHIGWGAIRLEPTWMSLGEAAAHATVLAIRQKKMPAAIAVDGLLRRLAERRVMLSFFNDVEVDPREAWYPAVQYFGTQGFFGTYEAQPLAALTLPLAEAWAAAAAEQIRGDNVDPTERARRVQTVEEQGGAPLTVEEFGAVLARAFKAAAVPLSFNELLTEVHLARDVRISRGGACRLMFAAGRK
jgi:FAD dependent oxidoreductase